SVTAWNPSPAGGEGGEVFGLAVAGDRVFVGGEFYTIGGKECRRLAAISAATGQATSWNTYVDGFGVFALGFDGTQLAAGGDFSMVGGVERNGLAALDILSGEATSWNPNVNGFVYPLAPTGNTLYAGGRSDSAGGLPRTNLVATDLMTGQVLPWSPNPSGGGFSIIYTLLHPPMPFMRVAFLIVLVAGLSRISHHWIPLPERPVRGSLAGSPVSLAVLSKRSPRVAPQSILAGFLPALAGCRVRVLRQSTPRPAPLR